MPAAEESERAFITLNAEIQHLPERNYMVTAVDYAVQAALEISQRVVENRDTRTPCAAADTREVRRPLGGEVTANLCLVRSENIYREPARRLDSGPYPRHPMNTEEHKWRIQRHGCEGIHGEPDWMTVRETCDNRYSGHKETAYSPEFILVDGGPFGCQVISDREHIHGSHPFFELGLDRFAAFCL